MPPQVPELLALALASGLASGLNVYASVAILGLIQYAGWLALPAPLDGMSHPWVIAAALLLYLIEFVADKIPYVDNVWDAVHTFIRIPIGALLAGGMFAQFPTHWQVIMAMAGGFLAFQAHGTKASIRLAANASPEPFSNWALSILEDVLVATLLWFAAKHPYITLVIVAVLAVGSFFLLRMVFRTIVRLWRKLFGGPTAEVAARPAR
jgi:uncharacterized membrane protein